MNTSQFLIDYLHGTLNAEKSFPIFLHTHVPRDKRLQLLQELTARHKVYTSENNGIRYVLDYLVAKELFANPDNAVRYTALLTDIESEQTDYLERILEYFPVFSDEEQYFVVRPYAQQVKEKVDSQLEKLNLDALISDGMMALKDEKVTFVDLLNSVVLTNARIALKALNWEDEISLESIVSASKQIFSLFRGGSGTLLSQNDIDKTYQAFSMLANKELTLKCLGSNPRDQESEYFMPAVFGQWISGFLTPCVTWTIYTFLRRFDSRIGRKHSNYDCRMREASYMNGCLKDFMPFQAIHRLIKRNCSINGVEFMKGDFICIIPEALFLSEGGNAVSSVIGAPHRSCMGMGVSTSIVKSYEEFFSQISSRLSNQWSIDYELMPSLSSLEFARVQIKRE